MWYGVDDKKVKERKMLISLGLCRGPIKSLTQDLHRSRRHQAPSRGGLRSPGRKVSTTCLQAPVSQPEKERERESKTKKTRGPKLWWSKGALMIFLSIYRLDKKLLSGMIEIRKPNVQQPLPREQGVMLVTRSGHNPYLKKGERD